MNIRIGKIQASFYVKRLEKRTGICSQKETREDKHILLWDFDNKDLGRIMASLTRLLLRYQLPNIYIIESSPQRYHAYSFTARTFRETIHILSDTPEIDLEYLRLGMVRGYYTLRITPRQNDIFKTVKVLASIHKDEIRYDELTINEYLTTNKGGI